jgi:DNA-binding transcriptional MerR regulator
MSAEAARAYFGIGEVLAQLRGEFPDVSVSKIRFLESEGLIQPARSPSGYRKFGPGDVARLRYILTAQRDEYLPLRVIKDRLDGVDGQAPDGPAPDGQGRRPHAVPALPGSAGGPLLTRRELLDTAGIDERRLAELEDYGLIRRSGRHYGQEALAAAQAVVALGGYGVQARHLRAVRAAAERETSLIEQIVAPTLRQRSPGARERAGQTAREIAALALKLHAALVTAALADAGYGEPGAGRGGA